MKSILKSFSEHGTFIHPDAMDYISSKDKPSEFASFLLKNLKEYPLVLTLDQIKSVYDDGEAEINGRSYNFGVMTFTERRKVFAYTSSIQGQLQTGNFSFLDDDKFKDVEKVILRNVTLEGQSLSKKNPFEDYPEDYIIFISTALNVISYPFLKGSFGK